MQQISKQNPLARTVIWPSPFHSKIYCASYTKIHTFVPELILREDERFI